MSEHGGNEKRVSKVTGEPRHWLEYGVFAFVILTALATATAAWYTRKEWQSSVDNGRRQLRAYVFPETATLHWSGSAKPMVAEITLKNSGQTPAYRVAAELAINVREYPLQARLPAAKLPSTHTIIPPTGVYTLSTTAPRALTDDELTAIQQGHQAIYVIGDMSHDDAFGVCRIARYEFFFTGEPPKDNGNIDLKYYGEGNTERTCQPAD